MKMKRPSRLDFSPGNRPPATDRPQAEDEFIEDPDEIRSDKVNRVRAALAEGNYDEEDLLDLALVSLAEDIELTSREEDGDDQEW